LLLNPYFFATSDHTYKIPFLKAATSGTGLYAKDITVAMWHEYTSIFPWLIWPLQKILGFQDAFFLIYILTQILFYTSIYLLASNIFRERFVGLISVALLLFPKTILGGIETYDSIVEERTVAMVLFLFAIYLLLKNRQVLAVILFSLVLNLHFVTFINGALFLVTILILERLEERDGPPLIQRYNHFIFFLLIGAIPFVIMKVASCASSNLLTMVDPMWLKMILVRSPEHFLPDGKALGIFMLNTVPILVLGLGLYMMRDCNVKQGLRIFLASLMATAVGYCLAWFFLLRFPLLIGIQCCFLRASYFQGVFSQMMWAYIIYVVFNRVALCLPFFNNSVRSGILFVMIFVLCLGLTHHTRVRLSGPGIKGDSPTKKLQIWLKEHTIQDALVITPSYAWNQDFRVFSERATLGSWKDWTYNCLDRKFADKMYQRLKDVGNISLENPAQNDLGKMEEYYLSLKENNWAQIARKYGADYLVMERQRQLALKKVYEDRAYTIYKF